MEDKLQVLFESLKSNPNVKGLPDEFDVFSSTLNDPQKSEIFFQSLKANPNIKGLPDTYEDFVRGLSLNVGGVDVNTKEATINEEKPGFLPGLGKRLGVGFASLGQMITTKPQATEALANLPRNLYAQSLINKQEKEGRITPETAGYLKGNLSSITPKYSIFEPLPKMPGQETIGEALANSKLDTWFKENQKKLEETSQKYDKTAFEYLKNREYDKALGVIAYGIAESLPATIAAAFAPEGAVVLGLGTGALKYDEIKDRQDMSEAMKVADSFTTGLFEWLFEKCGSREMGKFLTDYVRKNGKESLVKALSSGPVMNLISKGYKKLGVWFAPVHEGLSEFLTTVGQNAAMIFSGEAPEISIWDNAVDSFLIGTGMGSVFSSIAKLAKRLSSRSGPQGTPLDQTPSPVIGPLKTPETIDAENIINIYGQRLKFNSSIPLDQDTDPKMLVASHKIENKKYFLTEQAGPADDAIYTGFDIDELKNAGYDFTKIKPQFIKSSDILEKMEIPYAQWLENEVNLYKQAKTASQTIVNAVNPPASEGQIVLIQGNPFVATSVTPNGITLNAINEAGEILPDNIVVTPDKYGEVFGQQTTQQPTQQAQPAEQILQPEPTQQIIAPETQQEAVSQEEQFQKAKLGSSDITYQTMPDGTFFIPASETDNLEAIIKQVKKEVDTDNFDVLPLFDEVPIPNVAPFARVKTLRVPKGISITPKQKEVKNDSQNQQGLPGQVGVRPEPEQAQFKQETGQGEAPAGGILQTQKEEITSKIPEPTEIKNIPVTPPAPAPQPKMPEESGPVSRMLKQFVKGNHVQNTKTGDVFEVKKINKKEAILKNLKTKEIKTFKSDSSHWIPVQKEVTLKERKKPGKLNPNSRTARALSKTPESFEEAVMQFFIGGGKIWTEDFKRYITGDSWKELTRFIGLYSNEGVHMDVLHEQLPNSFGIEERGAMDEINAIVELLRSPDTNTRSKMIDEMLRRIELSVGKTGQEDYEAVPPEDIDVITPEEFDLEQDIIQPETVEVFTDMLESPEIRDIIREFALEDGSFDVDKLLAKIEEDPGYFTIFHYDLSQDKLQSLKERLQDEQRQRKEQANKVPSELAQTEGRSREQADDRYIGRDETEVRRNEGAEAETEQPTTETGTVIPTDIPTGQVKQEPIWRMTKYKYAYSPIRWDGMPVSNNSGITNEIFRVKQNDDGSWDAWTEDINGNKDYWGRGISEMLAFDGGKRKVAYMNEKASTESMSRHYEEVKKALNEGKDVPDEVLKDYADLEARRLEAKQKATEKTEGNEHTVSKTEPEQSNLSGIEQARAIVEEIKNLDKPTKYLKELTLPREVENFFNYLKKSTVSKYTWSVFGKGFKPFNANKIRNFFFHVYDAMKGASGGSSRISNNILNEMGFDLNLVEKAEFDKIWFKNGVFLNITTGSFKSNENHFFAGTQVNLRGVVINKLMELVDKGLITKEQAYEIESEQPIQESETIEKPDNEIEQPAEKPKQATEQVAETLETKEYRYKMTARPFDVGTYPKEGFVRAENDPEGGYQILVYNKKLTPQEWSKWDFLPIDEINAIKGKLFKDKDGYYSKISLEWYKDNKGAKVSMYDTEGTLVEEPFGMSTKDILKNIEDGEWIVVNPITNQAHVYTKEKYPFLTDEEINTLNRFKANPQEFTKEQLQPIFNKINNPPKAEKQPTKTNDKTVDDQLKLLKLTVETKHDIDETKNKIAKLKSIPENDLTKSQKAELKQLTIHSETIEKNLEDFERRIDDSIVSPEKQEKIKKLYSESYARIRAMMNRILRLQDERDAKERKLQNRNTLFGDAQLEAEQRVGLQRLFGSEFQPTSENLQMALKPFDDEIKSIENEIKREEQLTDERINEILKGSQQELFTETAKQEVSESKAEPDILEQEEEESDQQETEGVEMSQVDIMDEKNNILQSENEIKSITDWGEKIGGARKDIANKNIIKAAKEKDTKNLPAWMKGWNIEKTPDGKFKPFKSLASGAINIVVYESKSAFDTEDDALMYIKLLECNKKFGIYAREQDNYSIYYKVKSGSSTKLNNIKEGFKTRDEAYRWIIENIDDLLKYRPVFPTRPHLEKIERTGKQHRHGNITVQTFSDTFGFAGGEFGNWVPQDERQTILNMAYDALMDLANVLNVHPRALSLGGKLSIAFGARGRGGFKDVAKAHYEPNRAVFNLTRINGAGSVAHEWFHAVDHYLGLQDSGASLTKDEQGLISKHEPSKYFLSGYGHLGHLLRPELKKAFEKVLNAVQHQPKETTVDIDRLDKKISSIKNSILQNIEYYIEQPFKQGKWSSNKQKYTPPTDEQVRRFNELKEKINAGEYGEKIHYETKERYIGARTTFKNILELNNLYKEVTGRSRLSTGQTLHNVTIQIKDLQKLEAEKEEVKSKPTKIVETRTNYLRDAKDMDRLRSTDYWSLPHELLARAFESYVEDKIKATGNVSDYLVYGTDPAYYKSTFNLNPFPEGEEREAINKAFDELFSVIKTRHEEGDAVILHEKAEQYIKKNGVYETVYPKEDWKEGEAFVSERKNPEIAQQLTLFADYTTTPNEELIVYAERLIRENGYITFIGEPIKGPVKITSPNDVAFLFRHLEKASVENAFTVLIDENGNYKVLYVSTGTTYSSQIDLKSIIAAAKEFNAKKVCFVHNHPSGSLNASQADVFMHRKIQNALRTFDIELMDSVIIDLDKGSFGVFNDILDYTNKTALNYETYNDTDLIEPKILTFDKQKLYVPSNEWTQIRGSGDVATYLSKMKRGATPKIHAIILDRGNFIKKYLLYDETIEREKFAQELLYEISKHGEQVILASNRNLSVDFVKYLNEKLQSGTDGILDVIHIQDHEDIVNNYKSWADYGIDWTSEPDIEYERQTNEPGINFRISDDIYFSTVEKALEKIQQTKGTPQQMTAMLKKLGAKEAELAWMGWDEFIAGKEILTKNEISEWINNNKIQIKEEGFEEEPRYSVKDAFGNKRYFYSEKEALEFIEEEKEWIENDSINIFEEEDGKIISVRDSENNELFRAELDEDDGEAYDVTYHYAESEEMRFKDYDEAIEYAAELASSLKDMYFSDLSGPVNEEVNLLKYSGYVESHGKDYKELLFTLPKSLGDFQSVHWVQKNVFAHARVQTYDIFGKETLFIEEVQSDWAQEGRKEGFKKKENAQEIFAQIKANTERRRKIITELTDLEGKAIKLGINPYSNSLEYDYENPSHSFLKSINEEYLTLSNRLSVEEDTETQKVLRDRLFEIRNEIIKTANDIIRLRKERDELTYQIESDQARVDRSVMGIPDMPFKQTKQWAGLVMRRLLRYAVDNGFESIAFTTGEMQNDRYKLRNYISAIHVQKIYRASNSGGDPIPIYDLKVYPKNKSDYPQDFNLKENELPDYVGKEMAQRIINDSKDEELHKYEGLDLEIGGEGMIEFYDKILPNIINDFTKKFGTTVETISSNINTTLIVVRNANSLKYDIVDEKKDIVVESGFFTFEGAVDRKYMLSERYGKKIHYLKITEALRNSLMDGVPLFRTEKLSSKQLLDSLINGPSQKDKEVITEKIKILAKELGKRINIVNNKAQLPDPIKRQIRKRKLENKLLPGVYDEVTGEIYIVLNDVYDVRDAVKTVLHEVIGHEGVEKLLKGEYIKVLREIYDSMPEQERSRIRNIYGENTTDYEVAKEYLGYMAEKNVQPSLYQRVLAKIKQLLRKFFKISFTENDIHNLLYQARKFMAAKAKPRPSDFESPADYIEALTAYEIGQNAPKTHGYGYYFTDIAGVQEQRESALRILDTYLNNLSKKIGKDSADVLNKALFLNRYNTDKALDMLRKKRSGYHGNSNNYKLLNSLIEYCEQNPLPQYQTIQQVLISKPRPGSGLMFVDENKPLSSANVKQISEIIQRQGISSGVLDMALWNIVPARKVYDILASEVGSDEVASEIFYKAGIDGMTFMSPTGSTGYVLFSDSDFAVDKSARFRAVNKSIVPPPPDMPLTEMAAEAYDKDEVKRTWKETVQGIREYIQDMNLPIRKFEEELLRRGGVQDDNSKPYRDTNLAFGRMEKLYEDYFKQKMKPIIETVTKMIKSGAPFEYILPYVICKHAIERNAYMRDREFNEWYKKAQEKYNKKGQQVPTQEIEEKRASLQNKDYSGVMPFDQNKAYQNDPDRLASDIIKEFEANISPDLVDELWNRINEATRETLHTWYTGGQISADQFNELSKRFKYFVPLRGWRHDAAYRLVYTKGEGFKRSYMTAEGRKSLAENPLAYILNVQFKALGEKVDNEVKTSMLNLLLSNLTNSEINEMATIKKLWYVTIDLPDGTQEIIPMTERPTADMFENGQVSQKIFTEHEKLRAPHNADEHEVIVKRPGGDMVMVFKDNWLPVAQALNKRNYMYRYIFGGVRDAKIINNALRGLAIWNNILKALYTQWNIVFPFTNFFRDFQEALATQYIKDRNASKVSGHYKDAFPAIIRYLFGKSDNNNPIDIALDRFYKLGGATGYTHLKTAEEIEKDIKKEISRMVSRGTISGEMRNAATNLLRTISGWNRLFEDATRFSIFLASLDEGKTEKDAAFDAKEATINFNRTGKGSKAWDAIYAFFNVSVQSLQKNFKLAKDYPKRFSYVVGTFIMLGFLEALMNDWADDDDDKNKDYYNINPYMRHNYLIIPNIPAIIAGKKSDKYLSIPLPQFWRGFKSIGAIGYDIVNKRTTIKDGIIEALANFMTSLLPIDIGGFYREGEFSLAPIAPTIIKPIVEVLENRDYMGFTISKEPFTKEQKKYLANAGLGKDNVNPAAKFMTDLLFRWAGGDNATKFYIDNKGNRKKVPAVLDINPSWIEHLLKGYTGGTGGVLSDMITTVTQAINKDLEVDFKNVPFVNRFIRKIPEAKWNIIAEYYNNREMANGLDILENEYEKQALKNKPGKYETLMNNSYFNEIRGVYENYESQIQSLVKIKSGVMPDDNDELSTVIIELMDQCNKEIKNIKSRYNR